MSKVMTCWNVASIQSQSWSDAKSKLIKIHKFTKSKLISNGDDYQVDGTIHQIE